MNIPTAGRAIDARDRLTMLAIANTVVVTKTIADTTLGMSAIVQIGTATPLVVRHIGQIQERLLDRGRLREGTLAIVAAMTEGMR